MSLSHSEMKYPRRITLTSTRYVDCENCYIVKSRGTSKLLQLITNGYEWKFECGRKRKKIISVSHCIVAGVTTTKGLMCSVCDD